MAIFGRLRRATAIPGAIPGAIPEAIPGAVPGAVRGLAAALSLALFVAACTATSPAVCPRVAVLAQASSLTKFAPGGTGPNDVSVQAEMVGVEIDCLYRGDQSAELESNMAMEITARRGPAMRGQEIDVEYFVVITDRSGNVLTKRVFPLRLDFGSGSTLRLKEHTWEQYQLRDGGSGSSYEIWTGFQLSDEELKYNREQRAQ